MSPPMLRVCGHAGFKIRGRCAACAPLAHQEWQAELVTFEWLAKKFHAETGKTPLDDYDGFDQWVRNHAQTVG